MFNIKCRVSGGVTGIREALLKENGVVTRFATLGEAETHAAHLNKQMNGPHATATFCYTPIPANSWSYTQVHRFHKRVAIYLGGKTQYFTPQEALKFADALCKTADDVNDLDFLKTTVGTFEMEFEGDMNGN